MIEFDNPLGTKMATQRGDTSVEAKVKHRKVKRFPSDFFSTLDDRTDRHVPKISRMVFRKHR